jgi:hypothetical protein
MCDSRVPVVGWITHGRPLWPTGYHWLRFPIGGLDMRLLSAALSASLFLLLLPAASGAGTREPRIKGPWSAVHLLNYQTDEELAGIEKQLPALAALGVNVIVLEVDYGFDFRSHPELRKSDRPISRKGARRFVKACRRRGIHVIPEFQSFGHQSWAGETFGLLTKYPELDLTPGAFPGNEGIYCREWDPYNPRVYEIVFPLIDEIIDAFDADAFHVGMDEVFLMTKPEAPSTKDKNPADVYAKVVNDMYAHIVKKRGRTMLMWGDRFIDAAVHDYGEWESAKNGTAPAIDKVPKDIVICDWHYELREDGYPSVPMFLEKGFRVLPTSWRTPEQTARYIDYTRALRHPRMLGHLFSTWEKLDVIADWPPLAQHAERVRKPQ